MMWDRPHYYDFLRSIAAQPAAELKRVRELAAAGPSEGSTS
jgi:hypothetical protein